MNAKHGQSGFYHIGKDGKLRPIFTHASWYEECQLRPDVCAPQKTAEESQPNAQQAAGQNDDTSPGTA